jgi:hypothetical protein
MSVKTVEATLELLTLAHEVVLLRKERAEATVLMEQAADDLEKLKAENERLRNELHIAEQWSARVYAGRDQDIAEITRLRAALRGAYEVYAGSDGFVPETAAEGYQQQIIKQMVDAISTALAKEEKADG